MKIAKLTILVFLCLTILVFSQTTLTIDGKTFQKDPNQSLVIWSENENGDVQFQPLARADSIVTAIFSFKSPPLILLKTGETPLVYHEHEQFKQSVIGRSTLPFRSLKPARTRYCTIIMLLSTALRSRVVWIAYGSLPSSPWLPAILWNERFKPL